MKKTAVLNAEEDFHLNKMRTYPNENQLDKEEFDLAFSKFSKQTQKFNV
jgi:hypothetical protein